MIITVRIDLIFITVIKNFFLKFFVTASNRRFSTLHVALKPRAASAESVEEGKRARVSFALQSEVPASAVRLGSPAASPVLAHRVSNLG